jgi:hypothetical protein
VAAAPIAPATEYHPLAMQEPAAGTAAEPPPAPAPAPQVEALPEVKAASEYAYDPPPSSVSEPSGSGAGVSSSGEAPMTLSRPPVEGAPIDLIAVSGAKRRLLVPGRSCRHRCGRGVVILHA